MTLRQMFLSFAFAMALLQAGCLADASDPSTDPAVEEVGVTAEELQLASFSTTSAQRTRMSYDCSWWTCTCTGDSDCNDMFGSNVCGKLAACNETTGKCWCERY